MAKRMMEKLKSKIGIAQKDAKNAPASAPGKDGQMDGAEDAPREEAAQSAEKKNPAAEPKKLIGWYPEIYDDTDVCRVVGWRRGKLVENRKPWTKWAEWDCIGGHIGMTGEWLRQIKGVKEAEWLKWAEANGLRRIERDDGIWTVRMVKRHPNIQVVTVEMLATGETTICRVRNSHQIAMGEVFDSKKDRGRLYLVESLNTERW